MNSGIYQIRCKESGNLYVGSAVDFNNRWKMHLHLLNRGKHHSRHMQAAWIKYGESAFEFERLLICERKDLLMYEQIVLDAMSPEYNTAKIAGSCLGLRHSAETKAKQAAAKFGNKNTLGYRHTPEALKKLREKQLGVPSPTKGTRRSPEAIAATAAAHRGRKRSPETRLRISLAQQAAWARKKEQSK